MRLKPIYAIIYRIFCERTTAIQQEKLFSPKFALTILGGSPKQRRNPHRGVKIGCFLNFLCPIFPGAKLGGER